MLNLTPDEYEEEVAKILEASNCGLKDFKVTRKERVSGHDGDYEMDVVARFTAIGSNFTVLVECKHHKNPIKRDIVQILKTKIDSAGAQKGMIFTTSSFQRGAIQFAEKHGIALIEFKDGMTSYITNSLIPPTQRPQHIPKAVGWLIGSKPDILNSLISRNLSDNLDNFLSPLNINIKINSNEPAKSNSNDPTVEKILKLIEELEITQNEFSEIVGEKNNSYLSKVLSGEIHPDFSFLERICEKFNVNEKWLKHNHWEMFNVIHEWDWMSLEDVDDVISNLKETDEVYVILNKEKEGRYTSFFVRENQYRYRVYGHIVPLSSHVGGTGSFQLYILYKFLKKLCELHSSHFPHAMSLTNEEFRGIMDGFASPKKVIKKYYFNEHWLLDFTSLDHSYKSPEEFTKTHGEEFVKAQEIVRKQIAQHEKPNAR
jgi:restriction system protein